MKKQILAVILALTMAAVQPISSFADTTEAKTQPGEVSGTCGENLTWSLEKNGTLTVRGEGAMTDFICYGTKWGNDIKENVTEIVLKDGVTNIRKSVFLGCDNLTSVTIPQSVTSIEEQAFRGCAKLSAITIPGSVESIGNRAFYNCTGLTKVSIKKGVNHIGESAFANCTQFNKFGNC